MRVVNFGGGVNSTALLCLAVKEKIPVDIVVFSDTGSERPETYSYLSMFSAWLVSNGLPLITVVRWIRVRGELAGKFIPLHEWCETEKTLPSRSFGMSGCTVKWKQQPVDGFLRRQLKDLHATGQRVERWIGYDADEPERAERMIAKNPDPHLWEWRAPLVERGIGRDGCLRLIANAGLPSPGKSSCWLCPSMKKHEITALGKTNPDLLDRALRIERVAVESGELLSVRGLGGRLNWDEFLKTQRGIDPPEIACGCFDGGDE